MNHGTYIEPHMTAALADHILEEVTPLQSPVRSFILQPPDGSRRMSTLITFTSEGIILQGDLRPGENGVISETGCDIDWFCGDPSEEELCSRFLHKEWQREAASRDLRHLAVSLGPVEAAQLISLREGVESGALDGRGLQKGLTLLGYSREAADEVGYDYPLADAGWLCAVQRQFAQKRRQVS